jgi:hypothetical protein
MKKIFIFITLLQVCIYSSANTFMYEKDRIGVTKPNETHLYLYHNKKSIIALRVSNNDYFNILDTKNGFIITKIHNQQKTKISIQTRQLSNKNISYSIDCESWHVF